MEEEACRKAEMEDRVCRKAEMEDRGLGVEWMCVEM
jgi:hypothetical protein